MDFEDDEGELDQRNQLAGNSSGGDPSQPDDLQQPAGGIEAQNVSTQEERNRFIEAYQTRKAAVVDAVRNQWTDLDRAKVPTGLHRPGMVVFFFPPDGDEPTVLASANIRDNKALGVVGGLFQRQVDFSLKDPAKAIQVCERECCVYP